ncbi:MAG: hypothetical protein WDZ82_01425 [Candidatus Paceibacterota bacterium]
MKRAKKYIYILAFTFLGLLISTVIHVGIEYPILLVFMAEGSFYGLSIETWHVIHRIGAFALWFAGLALGLQQGFYWWRKVYEK